MSRTLRPQPYESISFSITAGAADFPEAAELTAVDLRDYLHYQAAKAVAYFEIANGGDKAAITSHISRLHQFLKVERLGPMLVPPRELTEPAAPAAPPQPPPDDPNRDAIRRHNAAVKAGRPNPSQEECHPDPYDRYPGFPAPSHG